MDSEHPHDSRPQRPLARTTAGSAAAEYGPDLTRALLGALLDNSPEGILVAGGDHRLLSWNSRFQEMWGIPEDVLERGKGEEALRAGQDRVEDPEGFRREILRLNERLEESESGTLIYLRDGRVLERSSTGIRDGNGVYWGRSWFYLDITGKRRAETTLARSEARLAEAQRIANLGNWEWDIPSGSLWWSEEVFRIFGHAPYAFAPTYAAFLDTIHPDDRDRVQEAVATALSGHPYAIDHRILLPDGGERTVHEQGQAELDDSGQPVRMLGTVQDITRRKQAEDQLAYQAYHDLLTGLPNRRWVQEMLDRALNRALREGKRLALLFMDVDHFKDVNDSLGHHCGDQLLKAMARRLNAAIRTGDTVARLSGDEFAVVLEDIDRVQDATEATDRIFQGLTEPLEAGDETIQVSVSIGITLAPQDARDGEDLLRKADAAMYQAKTEGRSTYRFFTEELTQRARQRVRLRQQLTEAIERDQLALHFQPQYRLADERVIGVEALVRWDHPEEGLLGPDHFIPFAEESGLILPLGEWVLREACRMGCDWLGKGREFGHIAINLSAAQMQQGDLAASVRQALDESGFPPDRLVLEMTETAVMDRPEAAGDQLAPLRQLGVRVAIDDFGTGHSSLAQLKQLPIDTLKIDKGFVQDLPDDPDAKGITQAVIALAKTLGLRVLAEGVETEEQRRFLLGEGCDEGQGFLWARPLPDPLATAG